MITLDKVKEYSKETTESILNNEQVKKNTAPIRNSLARVFNWFKKWKGLVIFLDTKKIDREAFEWVCEITQRGEATNSQFIRQDLRQSNSKTILTKSGHLVSSYTTEADWLYGEEAAISQLYITCAIVLMVVLNVFGITSLNSLASIPVIGSLLHSGTGSIISAFSIIGAFLAPLALLFLYGATQGGNYSILKSYFKFLCYGIGFVGLFSIINVNANSPLLTAFAYSVPAFLMWYLSYSVDRKRGFELSLQAETHNGVLNEKFIKHDDTANPQLIQIRDDIEQNSPFITFGKSTGRMQRDGNPNSPDAGVDVGLTVEDTSTHIFIEGATGTGKTYLLNQLLSEVVVKNMEQDKETGMFVLCGKGELAKDLHAMMDKIISPETVKHFNFIKGLRPEQKLQILVKINNAEEDTGTNASFSIAAKKICYTAALAQDVLLEIRDLINPEISKVSSSFNYWRDLTALVVAPGILDNNKKCVSQPLLDLLKLHPNFETNNSVKEIVKRINSFQSEKELESTRTYLSIVDGWMSTISQSTLLYDWLDSDESDIEIYDIEYGKHYGLALKSETYGPAGTAINQFVKASLFNKFALRENGWRDDKRQTDIMLVIDECQDLVTNEDRVQATKARSRGLVLIYATQNKTNLDVKLGEKESDALLLSFLNHIQLKTGDVKSVEFMKFRLGKIRAIISSAAQGNPIDFGLTSEIVMRSPEFNSEHPDAHFIKFNGSSVKATNKFFGSLKKDGTKNDKLSESHVLATYKYNEDQPYRDVLTPEIIKALDVKRHAVMRVQRAGMPREDLIKVYGISSKEVTQKIQKARFEYNKRHGINLSKPE